MDISISGFDWDEGNRAKCQKHGVSSAEVESVFRSPVAIAPTGAPLSAEERFKAIGVANSGRYVFVVFTSRKRGDATALRPISARYMHRKEIDHYEKTSKVENG